MKTKICSVLVALTFIFGACNKDMQEETNADGTKTFVTNVNCRQDLAVLDKATWDSFNGLSLLNTWFGNGDKVRIDDGIYFTVQSPVMVGQQIWLTIEEGAAPGFVEIAVYDGTKYTYHFKVNTETCAGQYNLGMYGYIQVKYSFEPKAVAQDILVDFGFTVDGVYTSVYGVTFKEGYKLTEADWDAIFAAPEMIAADLVASKLDGWYLACTGAVYAGAKPDVEVQLCWGGTRMYLHGQYTPAVQPPPVEEFTINFPGMEGVKVEYYTNVANWKTVELAADDTWTFSIPDADKATYGPTTFRVSKGGSSYTITVQDGVWVYDVPVATIAVFGVSIPCKLAIVQSNWVYPYADANVGVFNYFNVFDNGKDYEVRVSKTGFYNVEKIIALPVSGGVANNPNDAGPDYHYQVYFGPSYFYQYTVPAGFTNIRMQSNNWFVNSPAAKEGDMIQYLRDYGKEKTAKMSFTYGGKTYSNVEFLLDGTDPFKGLKIVNFPGMENVTIRYNLNGWQPVAGTFSNGANIKLPDGADKVQLHIDGVMYSQVITIDATDVLIDFAALIGTLNVDVAQACKIMIAQSGNEYLYSANAVPGVTNSFLVFKGSDYFVREEIDGVQIGSQTISM